MKYYLNNKLLIYLEQTNIIILFIVKILGYNKIKINVIFIFRLIKKKNIMKNKF